MTQMYVITSSGGSYDDAWVHTEYVTDDLVKGQAYVDRMNAFRDEVIAARKLLDQWDDQWRKNNPKPLLVEPHHQLAPRWTGGQVITQEMRDERASIEAANQVARAEAYAPMREWTDDWWAAHNAFKATLSQEIQTGLEKGYCDSYWEIEPIEVLE